MLIFCLLKVARLVSSTSSGGFQVLYPVCIVCVQAQTSFSASLGTDVAAFCSVCSRLHADANCDDIQRLAVHKRRFWSFVGLLYLQLQTVTVCWCCGGPLPLTNWTGSQMIHDQMSCDTIVGIHCTLQAFLIVVSKSRAAIYLLQWNWYSVSCYVTQCDVNSHLLLLLLCWRSFS